MPMKVQRRMCDTCIFGARSPIPPSRFEELKRKWEKDDQAQNCHHADNVACRGHFEAGRSGDLPYPVQRAVCKALKISIDDNEAAFQIAERLGLIVYVDEDKL